MTAVRNWIRRLAVPDWIALAATVLGLALRVEHALTFDGPARGSDYAVYVDGVRWMAEHRRSFDFDPTASLNVGYQPPLWYALGALILAITESERAISSLAVGGWIVRQLLLARILGGPERAWSRMAALSLHAVLPLSVLMDGKVNPEGLHATLFMAAAYFLFRMERQLASEHGVRVSTACAFGLAAGLGILTKATSSVLLMAAGTCLLIRGVSVIRESGWRSTWQRLVRPAMLALAVCGALTIWWCVPNYRRFGHPFPHAWDVQPDEETLAIAETPALRRRPLDWFLPLETTYLDTPILASATEPRSNFWAAAIGGAWSDWYNRGFCRRGGKTKIVTVWGYAEAPEPKQWVVSRRCMRTFAWMTRVGALLSFGAIAAIATTAFQNLRTRGRRGSLVLPLAASLVVFFVMLFALVHPRDEAAVLKPAYMLSAAAPITACVGLALGSLEQRGGSKPSILHWLTLAAVATIAGLVVACRVGF